MISHREKLVMMKTCFHNFKRPDSYWIGRLWYILCKNVIGILFVTSLAIIMILTIRGEGIAMPEGTAGRMNALLLTLCSSYVAAWIFYVCTDLLPSLHTRRNSKECVEAKINRIREISEYQILNSKMFHITESPDDKFPDEREFVDWYCQDDLFKIVETTGKSRYQESLDDCEEIRKLAGELLLTYSRLLGYDDLRKLRYIIKRYRLDEYLQERLKCDDGKTEYDKWFWENQALSIYEIYKIMSTERFHVPKFEKENELRDERFYNRCNCRFNGNLCNGDYVAS